MDSLIPPPIRRIAVDESPTTVAPPPADERRPDGEANGHRAGMFGTPTPRARSGRPGVERMRTERLTIAYGEKVAVNSVSLPVRQGEILAETEPAAVSKAKSAAEKKGAKGVGALDTDNYASLDAGSYLIYSGVYEDKKAAREALAGLKKDFPKASVARIDENAKERGDEKAFSGKKEAATVDRKQLKELQDLSSEEYSKRSAKVPNQTKIPGKAPKKQKERTNFEDTIK